MKRSIIMPLLAQLSKARKNKKWSQVEMCKLIGVPQSYISAVENGKHDIRLATFIDLARLLDLEVVLVPRESKIRVERFIKSMQNDFAHDYDDDFDDRAFILTGDK